MNETDRRSELVSELDDLRAKVADAHDPYEAAGGYIECTCGWPRRDDFKAHGKEWYPDYIAHVFEAFDALAAAGDGARTAPTPVERCAVTDEKWGRCLGPSGHVPERLHAFERVPGPPNPPRWDPPSSGAAGETRGRVQIHFDPPRERVVYVPCRRGRKCP